MNAIWDKEGQFVCVIRNPLIAEMRRQELGGTCEALTETPGSSPPEFPTKTIPGAVIMRAGGVEWVRRQAKSLVPSEDSATHIHAGPVVIKKRTAKVENTEEPAEVKDEAEITAPAESGVVIENG